MCGMASHAGGPRRSGPHGGGALVAIRTVNLTVRNPLASPPRAQLDCYRQVVGSKPFAKQPRLPEDAARPPQRPVRGCESQVASHGRRARHRGTLLPQHGGVDLSPHGHPQTPHSAAPVVSLPDIREMRRGHHSGLYGAGAGNIRWEDFVAKRAVFGNIRWKDFVSKRAVFGHIRWEDFVNKRAVFVHIRREDFVHKRAVFVDILYCLKTLCRWPAPPHRVGLTHWPRPQPPQTPHSATTWFHCPDTREMQRGRHNGLLGLGAGHNVRAGGDTLITAISRI